VSNILTIRPLEGLDLDRASAVHGEAFATLGERPWAPQEIAELLATPGVAGLLLQRDGEAIGLALFRTVADEAELLTIAVHPNHRRLGAGKALLSKVMDLSRARGAQSLFLEVGVDNPAALALYRRAGFGAIGHRAAYYSRNDRPPADALVMRLALD
jgi:[ribosomal protein S18]-alanine N-acetyltransferase